MKITSNPTGKEWNKWTNSMTHWKKINHQPTEGIKVLQNNLNSHTRDTTNNYQPAQSEEEFYLQKVLKSPPTTRLRKQISPKDQFMSPFGNISIIMASKHKNKS